jgi:aminopeptidase N
MSTYLVALVISDFKCKYGLANAGPTGKVNVSACGRPNAFNQLDYGLTLAIKVLEDYEKYFGIDYTLKKLGLYI